MCCGRVARALIISSSSIGRAFAIELSSGSRIGRSLYLIFLLCLPEIHDGVVCVGSASISFTFVMMCALCRSVTLSRSSVTKRPEKSTCYHGSSSNSVILLCTAVVYSTRSSWYYSKYSKT